MNQTKKILLWLSHTILHPILRTGSLLFGYRRSKCVLHKNRLRVLIAGGYGYGNVGDEAQLAANLQHWKKASPGCTLTILTPNLQYTEDVHGSVHTELAPRISLFGKGQKRYFGSEKKFRWKFFLVATLCLFNTYLMRAGLPIFCLTSRQARLLDEIKNSNVLFLSGGGYLTGMTLSRLWDNMLLIRLAHALGVPTILSGQTIGVFKDPVSRILAKWGLKKAELIYLRDHDNSPRDLALIEIPPERFTATFDDALFYKAAPEEIALSLLRDCGLDLEKPYMAVNAHYWGQKPDDSRVIMKNLAMVLDRIHDEFAFQTVFVPMHEKDEKAIEEIQQNMRNSSFLPQLVYDPAVTVGVIQQANLCLTMKHHPIIFGMGAGVPTISMSFDDYYWHKNSGAQKIFDQEDYALSCNSEDLYEKVFEAFSKLQKKGDESNKEILGKLELLRSRSGEVINKWLWNMDKNS